MHSFGKSIVTFQKVAKLRNFHHNTSNYFRFEKYIKIMSILKIVEFIFLWIRNWRFLHGSTPHTVRFVIVCVPSLG